MVLDYDQLVQNVTMDEGYRAKEVFQECLSRGSTHEKALACVWRAARIRTKLSMREREKIKAAGGEAYLKRLSKDLDAQAAKDDLAPIEPIEEGILDE